MHTKKAQGAHKPGGGTPPNIDTGSFVACGSIRGRVDLVVTNGKVPGVEDDVEGSPNSPAARLVVWDKDGDGYKPSKRKVAKTVHSLRRIPPLKRGGSKHNPAEDVLALLAEHEDRVSVDGAVPEYARVSGVAVKTVYERGLAAWPGEAATTLTSDQWAAARVKAFLDVAAGGDPGGYRRDLTLLSKAHRAHPEHKGAPEPETVEIDVSEVGRQVDMFSAPGGD